MKNKDVNLIPFHTIVAATSGDQKAIDAVLKHYEGYIITLSTREYKDEYGQRHNYVDEALRCRLETKLIMKTLNFKIT